MRKNDEFMLARREVDYACIKSIIKVLFSQNLIFMFDQKQAGLIFLFGFCTKSITYSQKQL